jgi:hypothetical protein
MHYESVLCGYCSKRLIHIQLTLELSSFNKCLKTLISKRSSRFEEPDEHYSVFLFL